MPRRRGGVWVDDEGKPIAQIVVNPDGTPINSLSDGHGTVLMAKFFQINRATNADGPAVVESVIDRKIRVLRYTLICAGATGVKWQSSTSNASGSGANTDLCPVLSFAANGGVSDAFCQYGLFETNVGEALKLNSTTTNQVSGYGTYVEVE